MNKFKFEISGELLFFDEQNYKSQFPKIILNLTDKDWITDQGSLAHLYSLGGYFFGTLQTEIINKYINSTDYALPISIINKLSNIRDEAFGGTRNLRNNQSDPPLNSSNYSIIEKLSLAIELYATEFKETLASNDLDIAFIKIISYLKKGDLDYDDHDSIDINKLQDYIKWLKIFNQETQQKHESNNRILKIETALNLFKRTEAEIKISKELESEWVSKRSTHFYILVILCLAIFGTFYIGYKLLQKWIINGNTAFDNCCEKMGFVDLIYGGVIYWGIQYKAITILVWFVAVSLLIQLTKT